MLPLPKIEQATEAEGPIFETVGKSVALVAPARYTFPEPSIVRCDPVLFPSVLAPPIKSE
jgi:hypothetical protein